MAISMYQNSIPVFIHMLGNLSAILKKGEEFAKAKGFEPEVLVNSRLAPDMFPLSRQVQIACDIARRCIGRLAGLELSPIEDKEKSFADLQARIDTTITFLKTVKPEQVDGSEQKPIVVEIPGNKLNFNGAGFLTTFSLPNLYFHITTTYNILRHNGVELGKRDYLGNIGS